MPNALIHRHPVDSLQAKFSMEFCMAALRPYGKAGLAEFNDDVVARPEVKAMIEHVHFGVNAEAEQAGYDDCACFPRWPSSKTSSIIAHIRELEELDDVRALTALLGA